MTPPSSTPSRPPFGTWNIAHRRDHSGDRTRRHKRGREPAVEPHERHNRQGESKNAREEAKRQQECVMVRDRATRGCEFIVPRRGTGRRWGDAAGALRARRAFATPSSARDVGQSERLRLPGPSQPPHQ